MPNPWLIAGFLAALILSTAAAAWKFYGLGYDAAAAKYEIANAETARQTTDILTRINAENALAVAALQARIAEYEAAVAAQQAKYNRLGKLYEDLKRTAHDDKTALSPGWRALFDGLRRIETDAAADGGD